MRLTHLADYAVVMMAAAARDGGDTPLSAADLADETGVPLPTAQKLMGKLKAAGLVTSLRGAAGGFTLARPMDQINLADIVEAVEGPIAMTICTEGRIDCALDARCRIKPHMGVVERTVKAALRAVSLETLSSTPAHPEEGLSKRSASKARLEGPSFETPLRLRSAAPQDERSRADEGQL